jgi:hypothetical protein
MRIMLNGYFSFASEEQSVPHHQQPPAGIFPMVAVDHDLKMLDG